jgi:hypothetical protein
MCKAHDVKDRRTRKRDVLQQQYQLLLNMSWQSDMKHPTPSEAAALQLHTVQSVHPALCSQTKDCTNS